MGHAGAVITGGRDTAAAKMEAMRGRRHPCRGKPGRARQHDGRGAEGLNRGGGSQPALSPRQRRRVIERHPYMLLYSGPVSLFARKVEIALHEKGLTFDRVMVPFTQQTGYTPKHPVVLQHNPRGQVPVLIDGDIALFDSTLILEYLEDAYPTPPLYPIGAKPRARCRMLELFADEIMLPPLRILMRRNEGRRAPQAEEAAAETALRTCYDQLEQKLGEDWATSAAMYRSPISASSSTCSTPAGCADPCSTATRVSPVGIAVWRHVRPSRRDR